MSYQCGVETGWILYKLTEQEFVIMTLHHTALNPTGITLVMSNMKKWLTSHHNSTNGATSVCLTSSEQFTDDAKQQHEEDPISVELGGARVCTVHIVFVYKMVFGQLV